MSHNDGYEFDWEDLGDIKTGRPNLGQETSVLSYRLLQFTFKDVLSKELGGERCNQLFIQAGRLAGQQFCRKLLDTTLPFEAFISALQKKLIELKIGVLRIEKADLANLDFTLTVSEDLDCSGLPIFGATVCDYDEGFLTGIFNEYLGREFSAKEIDCWATGDRTCRFRVHPA